MSDQPFLAPDIRPGWTYLKSNEKPSWLTDAEKNYRDCCDDVDVLNNMFDDSENEGEREDIQFAIKLANVRENFALERLNELRKVYQAGGHPVMMF